MKIAYDAKRFFHNASGLGNYSRDLVRILASYCPEHQYLLLDQKKSSYGEEILNLPNVSYFQTKSGKFSRQLQMGKEAQHAGAAIFHGLSGELPLRWNSQKIKKIVTVHDLIFKRFPQYYTWFDRKIHFWKFKKACEQADLIIAISEQTKLDIIEYLNVPEEKIRVIYQGCHQSFKSEPTADFIQQVREKFNLPERFVLNVGTIEPRKNLHNIVKALQGTDIPLVVVGKKQKNYFAKIEKQIRKNNVDVTFLDGVSMPELAAIYRLADIFVYPSFFEGFGIPVIESLFSQTPVITSNVSCLPEAGGPDSVYVNPNSHADIRAKIEFLWHNKAECTRRAEKGLQYAQKFADDKIAEAIMKVYQEVIS